jgi:hypothetical protein
LKPIQIVLLFLSSLFFVGCHTVGVQAEKEAEPATEVNADVSQDTSWYDLAIKTDSIEVFITALNNIIYLEDLEAYSKLNNSAHVKKTLSQHFAQASRNRPAMLNRFKVLMDYTGGICGSLINRDWSLQRIRIESDMQSGHVDYKIEEDDYTLWCSLTIEKHAGHFSITNQFNHYYNLGLYDFVVNFIELENNKKVRFNAARIGDKTLYTEWEKGLVAFDTYLHATSVDSTLPLIQRLRLALIDQLSDPQSKRRELSNLLAHHDQPTQFSIQKIFLAIEQPIDEEELLNKVQVAEQITGDRSAIRSIVASHLMAIDRTELAKFYLRTALLLEPTNSDAYFQLFEWHLVQQNYLNAIETLKVLEENFNYEFERDDFLSNDFYNDLVGQPEFNNWLPKS